MEWRLLDDLAGESWLPDALSSFQPVDPDREADESMASWLRQKASTDSRDVWLLVEDRRIAAFHSAECAAAKLRGGRVCESIHAAFAARDHAHAGLGQDITDHLCVLAKEAGLQLVTLDPLDADVAAVWRRYGFVDSLTPIQGDPEADDLRLALKLAQ